MTIGGRWCKYEIVKLECLSYIVRYRLWSFVYLLKLFATDWSCGASLELYCSMIHGFVVVVSVSCYL